MAKKKKDWPAIWTDVPPEIKASYSETWRRLGFAHERDCTRSIVREFIVKNKPKTE